MECKNCKEAMKKLAKNMHYCEKCNEIFELQEDKTFAPVKDKGKAIEELKAFLINGGTILKDIAEKLGVTVKKGEDDDESLCGF